MYVCMDYLISQQKCSFTHGFLHLFMRDEPIALRGMPRSPSTRQLKRGEQPIHLVRVVLNQFNRTGELGPILDGNTAVLLSGDDVVEFLTLCKK